MALRRTEMESALRWDTINKNKIYKNKYAQTDQNARGI